MTVFQWAIFTLLLVAYLLCGLNSSVLFEKDFAMNSLVKCFFSNVLTCNINQQLGTTYLPMMPSVFFFLRVREIRELGVGFFVWLVLLNLLSRRENVKSGSLKFLTWKLKT